MTPAETQLLIEEFDTKKRDIPQPIKGGCVQSDKLPQFFIHFRSDLTIGEIEERGEKYIYHHKVN